jgi:hypothetical protein
MFAKYMYAVMPHSSFAPITFIYFLNTTSGGHVKMWADLVRARMFFNYICDANNSWVNDTRAAFLL